MTVSSFFSRDLLNISLGIQKGHRYFSVSFKSLNYRLFRYDLSIDLGRCRVAPDAIFISEINRHTVLTEWTTERRPDERKVGQIRCCLHISRDELVNIAGIPASAGKESGVWLVILPEHLVNYKQIIEDNSFKTDRLLVSSYDYINQENKIQYCFGNLSDSTLSDALKSDVNFRAIPNFLPFGFDDFSSEEFKKGLYKRIAEQLLVFAVKKKFSFSSDEISAGAIGEHWDFLSRDLKASLKKQSKEVCRSFTQNALCEGWFSRGLEPNQWRLTPRDNEDLNFFRIKVGKAIKKIIAGKVKKVYQPDLFEEEESDFS